jgi:hypothetical protein
MGISNAVLHHPVAHHLSLLIHCLTCMCDGVLHHPVAHHLSLLIPCLTCMCDGEYKVTNGYQSSSFRGNAMLAAGLHLALRLKMHGAIPPLPHTSSQHSA